VKWEKRHAEIRRRAIIQLEKAIAEAKRLALAVHTLETRDPLIELRKTLRLREGAGQVRMLTHDPDEPVN
jgi:hypothetical protein